MLFRSAEFGDNIHGAIERLGEPAMVSSLETSPDGNYLLVETIRRPFSYTVPASRFPRRVEIWDQHGQSVHRLADLPLHDQVPIAFGSVPSGDYAIVDLSGRVFLDSRRHHRLNLRLENALDEQYSSIHTRGFTDGAATPFVEQLRKAEARDAADPERIEFATRAKYDAWQARKGARKDVAMRAYIKLVEHLQSL